MVSMLGKLFVSLFALGAMTTVAFCDTPVVVIDPGHPTDAKDRGHRGKKLSETTVNFNVAYLLAQKLETQGVKVILTKQDVRLLLSTQRRAMIANWNKAALFIRIHCDETTGSGYSLYYPAAPGVAPDGVTGPSPDVIKKSYAAAKLFHAAMAAAMKGELNDNGIKTDGQTAVGAKQGAFTGSIYAAVPTILIDLGVLTNAHDEKWLMSPKNTPKLVDAIDKGILATLGPEYGS
jgi:N-acetylmuramoyl-L-alanine amidase